MTRILVTGGLGFVGSHLVDSLIKNKDNKVTVIDNLCSDSSSADYMRDKVEYWIDDIRNIQKDSYSDREFDLIYHLAALARIQPSFTSPLDYLSTDIMGTSHILEFARKCGAKVIYAGSSSAFAGPMLNPYAFAKYTGEQVCSMYNKIYGMSVVTARFFNVYGRRQPTTGDYATVVGIFEDLTNKKKPLTITSDGKQRRDFTHISDIITGFEALGDKVWNGEVFQLGTGKNYSINELANMFGGEKQYIPDRPGEAKNTLSDNSEMRLSTGWKPKIKLEDYVREWKKRNII
jgi:nucleoside-diphosphate-sugar epimerase